MSRHILIVDDDQDAREILETVLSTLEIEVRPAADGLDALTHIFDDPPLLIVLDLSMPRLDGRGLLYNLRADSRTASIPVIIFTAHNVTPALADELGVPLARIACKGTLSMTELRRMVARTLAALDLAWTPAQAETLANLHYQAAH